MNKKVQVFVILLSAFTFAEAQQLPVCNPLLVEWFPHPHDCESYFICFHGIQHLLPCAPGLHFNAKELTCMFPEDAKCHVDYLCPPVDDDNNPVFLPDPYDCGVYYLCSRGSPIRRECAPGLWWDVRESWCNVWDDVVCDNRTVINPDNPGDRTTLAPITTTTQSVTTTTTQPPTTTTTQPPTTTTTQSPITTTLRPSIESCHMRQDLFNGNSYLKSMCIINTSLNYESARQRCVSLNMNLFIIDNSLIQGLFFEATTRLLLAHLNGFVWINGRRNSQSQWQVFNADDSVRGSLYSGVSWVNTSSISGPTNGDCLRYSSQFGPYQAMGIACNSNSWLICEHPMQTEQPSTTPMPTTTTQLLTTTIGDPTGPNLAACWRRDDLFHNGNYLKSSCIINTSHDYNGAEQACRTNRMELFVIDNSQTQIQFRNSTRQLLIQQPRGFVWINGKVDDDCKNWYVFNPQRSPLFLGVHWLQHDDFDGRSTGPCLRYTQQYTDDFYPMGVDCSSRSWLICEYSIPPQDVHGSDFI